jgi:hypothetical protein
MLLERVPLVGRSLRLAQKLAMHGLVWLDRVRIAAAADDSSGLRAQAQRFGAQAFRRVAARWPELAELVFGIKAEPAVPLRPPPRAAADRSEAVSERPVVPIDTATTRAWLAELAGADAWQARASAAKKLAGSTGDDVVIALRAALRDLSSEVAVAASESLASKPGDAPTQALLEVLRNTDGYFSPVARVAALRGLATRLGDSELTPLFAALRDVDAEVSIAAIVALSERAPDGIAAELDALLRDRSGFYLPIVRLAAANALLRLAALEASAVTSLCADETDPAIARVLHQVAHVVRS